jgi:hypothetical protein
MSNLILTSIRHSSLRERRRSLRAEIRQLGALSGDRANASRREFIADGLPAARIERVVGLADHDPLVADDPTSPRNRRISIVLLREAKEALPAAAR